MAHNLRQMARTRSHQVVTRHILQNPELVVPVVRTGISVSIQPYVTTADLGPRIAAVTCRINGRPAAVINTTARTDPLLRTQVALALLGAGIDAGHTMGALNGVRS